MKPYKTLNIPNPRIDVADALRGIAVAGIILYHSVEHFNTLDAVPEYSFAFDDKLFETPGIILAGKMYSLFAILFGLSFYIQKDNQEMKGKDFSLRFLWRMILLIWIFCLCAAGTVAGLYLMPFGTLESLWRKLTWMVPLDKK